MRNFEERIQAVKERTVELEKKRYMRNRGRIVLSSVCASLMILVAFSFWMPKWMEATELRSFLSVTQAGSVFTAGSGALGYILIALLAFILGGCVTLLSVLLYRRNQEENSDD